MLQTFTFLPHLKMTWGRKQSGTLIILPKCWAFKLQGWLVKVNQIWYDMISESALTGSAAPMWA